VVNYFGEYWSCNLVKNNSLEKKGRGSIKFEYPKEIKQGEATQNQTNKRKQTLKVYIV